MCKIRAEVFTTNNYTHIKTPDLPRNNFILFSTLNLLNKPRAFRHFIYTYIYIYIWVFFFPISHPFKLSCVERVWTENLCMTKKNKKQNKNKKKKNTCWTDLHISRIVKVTHVGFSLNISPLNCNNDNWQYIP